MTGYCLNVGKLEERKKALLEAFFSASFCKAMDLAEEQHCAYANQERRQRSNEYFALACS